VDTPRCRSCTAAEAIEEKGKPAYLNYFGDHGPSGRDITRATEDGLRDFAPGAEIYFDWVAVTQDQIDAYDLPTRPTKETDSRSRNFHGESVEVDALPPSVLREIARDCITQHVDDDAMERTRQVEEAEREALTRIAEHAPDLNHLRGTASS